MGNWFHPKIIGQFPPIISFCGLCALWCALVTCLGHFSSISPLPSRGSPVFVSPPRWDEGGESVKNRFNYNRSNKFESVRWVSKTEKKATVFIGIGPPIYSLFWKSTEKTRDGRAQFNYSRNRLSGDLISTTYTGQGFSFFIKIISGLVQGINFNLSLKKIHLNKSSEL